jgi:mRNA-degrading endonuclease toxin of MazEF toxin-antitoxin module
VAHAEDFGSESSLGIGQFLDEFHVAHVSGKMSVADRAEILRGFADDDCRLVANARCLTEGVDLPAVDMVAFCSPRRSRIDIIQAVGRAMRKPRGGDKTLGYVVVPILLAPHQATDLEDAARDTDWEDIVDVLAALRDADTRLEDLIRDAQIAKGRGEVFNPRIFAERIEVVGARVSLDVLVRHIGTVILESLGVSWDERYGQLCAIKDAGGDVNVSAEDPDPARKVLGQWLDTQRQAKKKGTLSAERIAELFALGVRWSKAPDDVFAAHCAVLQQINDAGGDVNVSSGKDVAENSWLSNQRQAKRKGTLSAERSAKLVALGVRWSVSVGTRVGTVIRMSWDERYGQLCAIKDAGGDVNVPTTDPLGSWLNKQRNRKKHGTLSAARFDKLDALGVWWGKSDALGVRWSKSLDDVFDANCAALQAIKDAGGDVNVSKYDPDPARRALGEWLAGQRKAKRKGTLSAERFAKLDALGVWWSKPRTP